MKTRPFAWAALAAILMRGAAAGAVHPVTIDPLPATPGWESGGYLGYHALYGWSVASAGDVDGDGYADLIVGARSYSLPPGEVGKAYVYYGSSTGLPAVPSWSSMGDVASGARFGYRVASAGDVNSDGYSDVLITTQGYYTAGKVFLFYGSPAGLDGNPALSPWTWNGILDATHEKYGYTAASAGDVDKDGYADVIVGAPAEGKAYVFYGSSSGLKTEGAWVSTGENPGEEYGTWVASAGDVDHDGCSDVLVGAPEYSQGRGKAVLFHGSPNGLSAVPKWVAIGTQPSAWFGRRVASAGDVDGDGFSDVIVAANGFDAQNTDAGRVYVYLGGQQGLSGEAVWSSSGDGGINTYYGSSVASAGDVNLDGYSDVLVGAHGYDGQAPNEGKAYLYYGSPLGVLVDSNWTATSAGSDNAFLGWSVAAAGDVNGDAAVDVVVGAPHFDWTLDNKQQGKALVFYGVAGASPENSAPVLVDTAPSPAPTQTIPGTTLPVTGVVAHSDDQPAAGGGGSCGCVGLEAVLMMLLLVLRRKRTEAV